MIFWRIRSSKEIKFFQNKKEWFSETFELYKKSFTRRAPKRLWILILSLWSWDENSFLQQIQKKNPDSPGPLGNFLHWNAATTGRGRSDLAPVCRRGVLATFAFYAGFFVLWKIFYQCLIDGKNLIFLTKNLPFINQSPFFGHK